MGRKNNRKATVVPNGIEWPFMALCGLVWPCMTSFTLYGIIWSCMVLYGLFMVFIVKYRFYWT